MTKQEAIALEKYDSIIKSCPHYPDCFPECKYGELCNHIISTAKSIFDRLSKI